MKRFKFKLEAVLLSRELEMKQAEAAYAEAIQKRKALQTENKELKENIQALQANMEEARGESFHPASQQHYVMAQDEAFRALSLKEEELVSLRQIENEKMKQFVNSKKAYDGLLDIRDRKLKEYLKEEAKREEQELEDVFSHRYTMSVE